MNNLGKMKTKVKRDDYAAETHQEKSRSCQVAFSFCFGLAQTRYNAARAKEGGREVLWTLKDSLSGQRRRSESSAPPHTECCEEQPAPQS